MNRLAIGAICAFAFGACKPSPSNQSESKFDKQVAASLENLELSRTSIETICQKNPIFIFIGKSVEEFEIGFGRNGFICLKDPPLVTFRAYHRVESSAAFTEVHDSRS